MKHIFTLLATLFILTSSLLAQKVAICGFRSDDPDGFSFVCLDVLTTGENIFFTDRNYLPASNNFNTGEAIIKYTVPAGGHAKGSVIAITESSSDVLSPAAATFVSLTGNFDLDAGGDQLYAFGASDPLNPNASITEIYSYAHFGSNNPASPNAANPADDVTPANISTGFSVILSGNNDNGQFTPGLRGNLVDLATFINTATNWTLNQNGLAPLDVLSTASFTNLQFGSGFPVEWLVFKANVDGSKVQLSWATASELNNDYFTIERSTDAMVFEEIGRQTGVGTSQEVQTYQFTDDQPQARTLYYRLRQVDFDGAFDYSQVVQVEGVQVSVSMKLYPNPISNELHVDHVKGTLQLYTLTGKLLQQYQLDSYENVIDVSSLDRGYYFALIIDENGNKYSRKIVK